MANATAGNATSDALCPPPFLPLGAYPPTGGYLKGRFCGPVTATQTCCLPCPLQQWVSSNAYERKANIAYWFNAPALACQVFLLLTFVLLPPEVSGRHYLSIGLCIALVLLEVSFLIPLATTPDECFDAVTPNDFHTSASCAVSGALLELGSMGAVVWIMLRSLWTHLRVVWDLQHNNYYIWLAHIIGWGLPALFMGISFPITGVSFRVGGACIPNPKGAFVTWFGWLIAFGCLGAIIQLSTTGFCLGVYVKSMLKHEKDMSLSTTTGASATNETAALGPKEGGGKAVPANKLRKRLAWRRVQKVLLLQWRSILLSLFVIVESIYFGTVYAAQVQNAKETAKPEHSIDVYRWTVCLIQSQGDKEKCMPLARALSVPEDTVVASWFMVSLIGIFTFCLMIRRTMIKGWWDLLRNPMRRGRSRNDSADEFGWAQPKRLSLGRILGSDRNPAVKGAKDIPEMPTGILPSPQKERPMSVPEAGEVDRRHGTTTLFDEDAGEKVNDDDGDEYSDEYGKGRRRPGREGGEV